MPRFTNNRVLVLDIIRGKWLLTGTAARKLLPAARSFLRREPVQGTHDEPIRLSFKAQDGSVVSVDSGQDAVLTQPYVLIVPVQGALTKYDNCFGTATMEVADVLDQFRDNENVIGFILDIDSPGGSVNAVMPLVQAIRRIQAAGKPVITHCDMAASAAYWIAAQTDLIVMDNSLSEVGSVGVYATIIDDRENKATGERRIDIYAPESEDKNRSYRDALEGDFTQLEKELSEVAQAFRAAVQEGRPKLDPETPGALTGSMFKAEKAVDLNMADAVGDLEACVDIVCIRSGRY